MGAKNRVIAGDYLNASVSFSLGSIMLSTGFNNFFYLDKGIVESYDIITEDIRKSATSGIARGAIGAALLGPVGLLAGLSAKNKGIHTIAVKFRDGKNSLIEVDDKVYKGFMKVMF